MSRWTETIKVGSGLFELLRQSWPLKVLPDQWARAWGESSSKAQKRKAKKGERGMGRKAEPVPGPAM